MPTMVKLAAAKGYKPGNAEQEAAYSAAKRAGPKDYDYVTEMENIRNSGGMYEILTDQAPVEVPLPRSVDDMSNDELKLAMVTLGIKTEKKMKRTDMITIVKSRMREIDVEVDETPDEDDE